MTNGVGQSGSSAIRSLGNNFVRLGRDGVATLLGPWLAIALVDFGFVAISIGALLIAGSAEPTTGVGVFIQLLTIVQVVAVMTLRVALLNTLRDVALGGPTAVGNLGAVVNDVRRRLGASFVITVVVGLIVSIGMVLCILPGLVALFFLAFAPYLVVARDMAVMESLRESARWAAREWMLLLTALVVAVVAVAALMMAAGVASAVGLRPSTGIAVGLIGGWAVNTLVGYLAFLWWGAVYVTAESRQQIQSLRETAPRGPSTYRAPDA